MSTRDSISCLRDGRNSGGTEVLRQFKPVYISETNNSILQDL